MSSLLSTLNLAASALQTQQQGIGVTGQNVANANNAAYSRQTLIIQSRAPTDTAMGSVGTGVEVAAIQQVRDGLLDQQVQGENSITSYLESQQSALQDAQSGLGEQISGSSTSSSVGTTGGLADDLTGLFNAFQSLSTAPASLSSRQAVISAAQQLAQQFNGAIASLNTVSAGLNQSVQTDVGSANQLLSDIAGLNKQISQAEATNGGTANDLRDLRQGKLESLAKLVNFQSSTGAEGGANVTVDGQLLVSDSAVQDTLQAYDAGSGQMMVRATNSATAVTLSGGSIEGAIEARDGGIASLKSGLNTLASQLMSRVNTVYQAGYDLKGNTGALLFTGTDASDIGVNPALANNASLFQASGVAGATGDNQTALALAQLGSTSLSALNNQTFSQSYDETATALGASLARVNSQLSDQQTVQAAIVSQRSSVSGVSIDEEMTNLMQYQRAYEASARMVSTLNTLLGELVTMKQ